MIRLIRPSAVRPATARGARRILDAQSAELPSRLSLRIRLSRALSFIEQRWFCRRGAGLRWVLQKIAKRIMPYPIGPAVVPTTLGFWILVDPTYDPVLETAIYYHGNYEQGTVEIMRRVLRKGDTFVDVGANLGFMSLAASRFVGPSGSVHAFEPHPDTQQTLERNRALNGATNIQIHRCGLGAKPEQRTLYERSDVSRGSASLVNPGKDLGKTTVEIRILDRVLEAFRVVSVRMVKIDVEGWEMEVLQGAERLLSRPDAPVLCVESSRIYGSPAGAQADAYRFIRSYGYLVGALKMGKKRVSDLRLIESETDLPEHDNLFCFSPRHMEECGGKLFRRS